MMFDSDGMQVVRDALQRLNQALDMLELAIDRRQADCSMDDRLKKKMQSQQVQDSLRLLQRENEAFKMRNAQLEKSNREVGMKIDRLSAVIEDIVESAASKSRD